ncbi:hypothetical protein SAG0147_02475 [Streptococcus agalactiae MRI Z1-048]|nr:hypothetical protein SAG0147_02475 [Streptococcus agalactiae MRI Z1-048]
MSETHSLIKYDGYISAMTQIMIMILLNVQAASVKGQQVRCP